MAGESAITVDVHLSARDLRAALEDDVRAGLGASPKSIPPLWFYDEVGSGLFEEITRLDEYYPTRAERRLLTVFAPAIAELAPGRHPGRARGGRLRQDPPPPRRHAGPGTAAPLRPLRRERRVPPRRRDRHRRGVSPTSRSAR